MGYKDILYNLPEVTSPKRKLDFMEKLKWTGVILVLYYLLSLIPLYGLDPTYQAKFESISVLLAAQFGSIISLGIGPIVTASIILQLLMGADIIKIDTNTVEGKKLYQGVQKMMSIVFIVFENAIYAVSGALPPATFTGVNMLIMVLQLVIGGLLLLFLDEVVSKWGIGSGISLFIAAGVSRQIFVSALNPLPSPINPSLPIGLVPQIFALVLQGLPQNAMWPIITLAATVIVFVIAVYMQAIRVEIPLTFGRVRGYSMRWPLSFVYTSNIPVILVAAMIASMQFWGLSLYHMGIPVLGTFEKTNVGGGVQEVPTSGLVKYLNPPTIRQIVLTGWTQDYALSILVYATFMIIGSGLFSYLWINVGGQDAGSVADQIMSSNLFIPGFRRDKRIIERMLNRYIVPLSIMGGVSVGAIAVIADLFGALSRGTGILLTVMILYQFYQIIERDHGKDLPPLVRRIFKK